MPWFFQVSHRSWDCFKIFCRTAMGWDIIARECDMCHQKPTLAVRIQPFVSCFCGKNKTILWNHRNTMDSQWAWKKKILFNMCLPASGRAQLKFRVRTFLKLTYKINSPWAFHLLTTPLKPVIDDYPPKDSAPPGSYVHGILQARILEWVAVFFSRGSSQPRNRICNSDISCISRQVLYC